MTPIIVRKETSEGGLGGARNGLFPLPEEGKAIAKWLNGVKCVLSFCLRGKRQSRGPPIEPRSVRKGPPLGGPRCPKLEF